MTEISGQFQISIQFQNNFAISGISGLLGPLLLITGLQQKKANEP